MEIGSRRSRVGVEALLGDIVIGLRSMVWVEMVSKNMSIFHVVERRAWRMCKSIGFTTLTGFFGLELQT